VGQHGARGTAVGKRLLMDTLEVPPVDPLYSDTFSRFLAADAGGVTETWPYGKECVAFAFGEANNPPLVAAGRSPRGADEFLVSPRCRRTNRKKRTAMNILRRLGGILLALALTAVAAPVLAQSKIYSLTVSAASVAAGQTGTIVATFKNESPNGNSSFNSIEGLKITGPLSITGVSVPNGSVQPSSFPAAGVKSINIVSMSPVKRGQTFAVTLAVKADSATGCTNSTATWGVDNVWTGSSLSGDTFARVPAGSPLPTTTVTGSGCTLSFQPAPSDAFVGQNITSTPFSNTGGSVKVKAVSGSGQPVAGVPVQLAKTAGSCDVTTANATTGSDGLATFASLTSSAPGNCTLTATTTTLGFGVAPAAAFNVVQGVLRLTGTGLGGTVVAPVSVTVTLVNASGGASINAGGTVGLVGTCASTGQTSAPAGSATISISPAPGTCTIGATGVFAGLTITSNPTESSQKVATVTASGDLNCSNVSQPGSEFNGTPGGGIDPAQTAYFFGFRAPDFKNPLCPLVPYSITNNIDGSGNVFDANGFILGPNTTAINYPSNPAVGVLLAHTITFAPVRSGSDGLPKATKKVTYCKENVSKDCTLQANRELALGCSSTAVLVGSIPGTEPGCIRGAAWVVVPASDPKCPAAGVGDGPVCIQHQVDILEKQDPPWGLTDE